MQVIVSRLAERDLMQIHGFIAQDNPVVADASRQKLLDHAKGLRTFPERGKFFQQRPGIRYSVEGAYLIIYRVDTARQEVHVLRFYHSARDYTRLRNL